MINALSYGDVNGRDETSSPDRSISDVIKDLCLRHNSLRSEESSEDYAVTIKKGIRRRGGSALTPALDGRGNRFIQEILNSPSCDYSPKWYEEHAIDAALKSEFPLGWDAYEAEYYRLLYPERGVLDIGGRNMTPHVWRMGAIVFAQDVRQNYCGLPTVAGFVDKVKAERIGGLTTEYCTMLATRIERIVGGGKDVPLDIVKLFAEKTVGFFLFLEPHQDYVRDQLMRRLGSLQRQYGRVTANA